jgi:hypothetical protein
MKRFLIFSAVGVAIITILVLAVLYVRLQHTKSFSPEDEVFYDDGDLKIRVFYNRPYKKNREIFGGLVPFDEVWRTGANEATTFETNRPISIEGKRLNPGKYTLWTVPDSVTWTVIFNSEYGQWGVDHNGEANRNPNRDVLNIPVHAVTQSREFEQFTITFEKMDGDAEMVLLWDKTVVAVPFTY